MKISMKRVAAFVLALVMVIGLVPVVNNTVNAAADFTNLTDKTLGVALTETTTGSTSTWSGAENTITGSLTGQKRTAALYLKASDTLTITNNKSSKAKLSFDYTTSGKLSTSNTITIGNEAAITAATSGSYTTELEAGASITIVLNVVQSRNGSNQIGISITNLTLAIVGGSAVDATFEAPAYGSYTVAYGDESVTVAAGTASQVITNMPSVKYTLTANPGEGYKFVGWYNVTTGKYLSTNPTYNCSFEEAATVKAVIVPADSAVFLTGGNYYTDLNEAVAYATANSLTQITLVQSGTLAANGTGYTIPAGITLLIPMDADYTPTGFNELGINPEYTLDVVTPYSYVTLTLAEGAALTVNGTVDIESKHTTLQGAANKRIHGGRPSGAYGAIYMSPNSTITLNNGANLYAWGYVYGDGSITANSGAKVYEYMQVTDFPGGGNLSLFVDAALDADGDGDGIYDNDYIKSFPFSQYYVQNIEVALTLMAGATESVFTTVTVQQMSMGMPVEFVGNNGMFVPGTGSITKDYDPSTDRLIVEVNGDATVRGIVMDMSKSPFAGAMEDIIGTSKFDSSRYILTLNSNITINVNSGTTTVAQDMALLPGVEIYIGKNATMRIAERTFADGEFNNLTMYGSGGYNVYVYDLDQFKNFVFQNQLLVPVSYSPTTGRYKRTVKDLKDAVIDIDGKLICDGFLYSTVETDPDTFEPIKGGAAIISSGKTGSIVFQNGCGIEEFAFCLDGNSNVDNFVEVDSAWLLNGDGSYVKTVCDACQFFDDENYDCTHVGQTYNYCSVHDLWYTEGHELCGKAVEITWIINGNDETQEVDYNTVPVYLGNPTKPADGCTVYTFAGWAKTADGEVLSELPAVTGGETFYAVFIESTVHVGDTDNDHLCNGCTAELSSCKDDDQNHICDYAGCDEKLSDCKDDNQNHECDYAGCDEVLSTCRDVNEDHVCDYLGCLKPIGECVDNDGDHLCDYANCDEKLSDCIDNDEDHYCDYAKCDEKLSDCVDDNDKDHDCDYVGCDEKNVDGGHHGGTAYCTALAICDECGEEYGSYDLSNHTGELEYTHVNEWNHKVTYSCCGAVVSEEEEHQYWDNDGYCVCGDVFIQIYVRKAKIFGIEMEAESIGIFVQPGTTYTLDLAPADGWEKVCVDIWDYSTDTLKTTLNATQLVLGPEYTSAHNEDLQIDIYGYWDIVFDLNGVDLIEGAEKWYPGYDPENGIATMPMPFDAYTTFDMIKYDFFREGYTLIGVTDGQTTYTGDEEIAPNGEDLHLTLIWKADHVCSENLTEVEAVEADCDTNGVKAYWSCSCGKYYADANASTEIPDLAAWKNGDGKIEKLGHGTIEGWEYMEYEDYHEVWCQDCWDYSYTEGHDYGEDHECDCGAVERYTITFMNGDSVYMEFPAPYGSPANFYGMPIPEVPTGYSWDGWYTSGGVKVEPGETWDADVVCYATFKVNSYTLTVETVIGNVDLTVPYGANLLEALAQAAAEGKIPAKGDWIRANDEKTNGEYYIVGSYYFIPSYSFVENNSTMPAENVTLLQGPHTYGWTMVDTDGDYVVDSWQYCDPEKGMLGEGWHYIEEDYDDVPGGAWYYFQHKLYSNVRVEGLNRVPYNTELGYGPDQEAMDYCANNGTTFIDAAEGWFVFDEDGKFQSDYTGVVIDGEYARYAVNGHIAWHVGLIENQGAYFYFTGDEVNGGNVMVAGRDYYLSRNNTELNVTIGGIYTFGVDGALCRFHGITENDLFEGKRLYIGGQLMIGAGLQDIHTAATGITNYFYVDSKGQLILDAEYYIGANNLGINSGIYYFDENGFMVIPEENGWNGIYNVDGIWYYYVNGEKAYCAGLIEIDGNWVYVKSDGSLATGVYYVTNTNGHETIASGTKCLFDENGFMQVALNGIVDGYYYVDNAIAYGAGLIEIDGSYYYVRSNGQIVTGRRYWVTNVNETGIEPAEYDFDENGKLIFPEVDTFTGIRDGKYYVNGQTAYGAGLIEIEEGKFIYVRSNGELATGKYWITNTNGEMAEGYYTFGEDGVLVSE